MSNHDAPLLTNEDYFRYLDRAAGVTRAEELEWLRAEVIGRYADDSRAGGLTEALDAHRQRLALREHLRRWPVGVARELDDTRPGPVTA